MKERYRGIKLFDIFILVGVFLIIVLAIFFFWRRRQWVTVTVKLSPENIFWEEARTPLWLAAQLKPGLVGYDNLGRKQIILKKVISWADGKRAQVYLQLEFRAVYNSHSHLYRFSGQPLVIGGNLQANLAGIRIQGLIVGISGFSDWRQRQLLEVKARLSYTNNAFPNVAGVMPWVAESIHQGDKVYNWQGQVVAEVISKKVFPAKRVVTTSNGRVFLRPDPQRKEVLLYLRLVVHKVNGEYYYLDNIPVRVNTAIPLRLRKITLWPLVTKIINSQ